MEKFISILYVTYLDDTPDKKSIYTHDTKDLAIKDAYVQMGKYMAFENIQSVMSIAGNSLGVIYLNEKWKIGNTVDPDALLAF